MSETRSVRVREAGEPADPAAGSQAEPMARERFEAPPVDIWETQDEIVLVADVPGVAPDGVDLRVENRELTLVARRAEATETGRRLHREHEPASYRRSFTLGNVIDQSKVSARLRDGVLTLRLPKVDQVRPRTIKVET